MFLTHALLLLLFLSASISWNFADFRVRYPSLASELCVSGVYWRLLLLDHEGAGQSHGDSWQLQQPALLFSGLYHRFLREADAGLLVEGQSAGDSDPATAGDGQ